MEHKGENAHGLIEAACLLHWRQQNLATIAMRTRAGLAVPEVHGTVA